MSETTHDETTSETTSRSTQVDATGGNAPGRSTRDPILELDGLTKRFGGLTAVDDLSFTVEAGEIVGFIGPNGAGKSTTFDCVMGIHQPTDGRIFYRGEDVTNLPPEKMVDRGLARTFQTFRPLRDRSVLANVQLALMPGTLFSLTKYDEPTVQRARDICDRVGLADRRHQTPDELPHAGLIRLEIARALATEPDTLLIDEAFAGLTTQEVTEISELLRELREDGMTIVIVDHNMRGLLDLIDRGVVIDFGQQIAAGTPEEIKRDERVQEAYLGADDEGTRASAGESTTPVRSSRDGRETGGEETPELLVEDLRVQYEQVTALRDVDLGVERGDVISIIGPNGAGKTTLTDTVMGFQPYEGHLQHRGIEVSSLSRRELVERGLIYCTETRDLFDEMTVQKNLKLGAYRHDEDFETNLEFVYDLFPRLEERQTQKAKTLSGGERQMLAIGRGLVADPDTLLLDEPTLGLAPVVIDDISEALEEISERGLTVVLCEQNAAFAMRHADHIYLLENGEIVRDGPPGALRDDAYVQDAYLG